MKASGFAILSAFQVLVCAACGSAGGEPQSESEALQTSDGESLSGSWVSACRTDQTRISVLFSATDPEAVEIKTEFFSSATCDSSGLIREDRVVMRATSKDSSEWTGSAAAVVGDGRLFTYSLEVQHVYQTAFDESGQTACTRSAAELGTVTDVEPSTAETDCGITLPSTDLRLFRPSDAAGGLTILDFADETDLELSS